MSGFFSPVVTAPGDGGIGRPIIQVLLDRPPSAAWYGYVGGGEATAAADTIAVNKALAANRVVGLPAGDLRATTTILMQPGGELHGSQFEESRINRHNYFAGPTIQVGLEDTGIGSQNFLIKRVFIDNPHPDFDAASSTILGTNRLIGDQAHIKVFSGTGGIIEQCYIQNSVYNVDVAGHTNLTIRECVMSGVWDHLNGDRQECKANIRLGRTAELPFTTMCKIINCYLAGVSNVSRTVTTGSGSYVARIDGGPRDSVLIEAAEGAQVLDSYIGANSGSAVKIYPDTGSIATNILIRGNFFDGAREASIRLTAGAGALSNMIRVIGNGFNGQEISEHVLRADAVSGAVTVANLVFANNQSNAHVKTPLMLLGVRGASITGNVMGGYNCRALFNDDQQGNAGAFVIEPSTEIHSSGNIWGGAVNDLGATNNCKWGFVGFSPVTGSASNERGILGLAGGAVTTGPFSPQTYPT